MKIRVLTACVMLSFAMHVVPAYGKEAPDIPTISAVNLKTIHDILGSDDPMLPHVQSICMIETRCGINTKSYSSAYGLMQIQAETARHVLVSNPNIVDAVCNWKTAPRKVIQRLLETDKRASVLIAKAILVENLMYSKGHMDKAIVAYNSGIVAALRTKLVVTEYLKQYRRWMPVVSKLKYDAEYSDVMQKQGVVEENNTQESITLINN